MARRRPDDKFARILETAASVFIEHGYRRTQMSDVAAAMGIAKGTLYLYVESKEALFDAALRYIDSGESVPSPTEFPLRTPRPQDTIRYVGEELARQSSLPSLQTALTQVDVPDIAEELSGILEQLYDVLARHRRRLTLIDRSARDYPELAALWFEGARGGVVSLLTSYFEDRARRRQIEIQGDVGVVARLFLETIAFWAVHRHWDRPPARTNRHDVREEDVKATVVHLLVRSVLKEKHS